MNNDNYRKKIEMNNNNCRNQERSSNDIFKIVKISLHSKTKCGQDFQKFHVWCFPVQHHHIKYEYANRIAQIMLSISI